jgi:hypothetical protein
MSHSDALSRLTVGGQGTTMLRWALRRAIDKVERDFKADARNIPDVIDGKCACRVTFFRAAAPRKVPA